MYFDQLAIVGELAIALNGPATRRVPLGGGELDGVAAVEAIHGLHESLAERCRAEDECAIMVLQCAGNDFRCGRRAAIREHDHGYCWSDGRPRSDVRDGGFATLADADDFLALAKEDVRHRIGLLEKSSPVAAQVEYDARGSFGGEARERRPYFGGSGFAKPLHRDVRDLAVEHNGVWHRRNADHFAGEGDGELIRTGPEKSGVDLCARRSLQPGGNLVDPPSADVGRVHADDLVTHANAGAFRRRVREDFFNCNKPFLTYDRHANATVKATGGLVEHLQILRRVQLRVRIFQLCDESARRLFVQRADRHRVNEALVDNADDLLEEPHAVLRCPFLHHKTAHDNWGNENGSNEGFSDARRSHGSFQEKDY